jgi:hypothetical protein
MVNGDTMSGRNEIVQFGCEEIIKRLRECPITETFVREPLAIKGYCGSGGRDDDFLYVFPRNVTNGNVDSLCVLVNVLIGYSNDRYGFPFHSTSVVRLS